MNWGKRWLSVEIRKVLDGIYGVCHDILYVILYEVIIQQAVSFTGQWDRDFFFYFIQVCIVRFFFFYNKYNSFTTKLNFYRKII